MNLNVFAVAMFGICLTAFVDALEPEFLVNVNCPLTKDMCRAMCNVYKSQVPKPTVYNWCIIGCHAANRGNRHCKRKCRYTDTPTRLTRSACMHGCTKYHEENEICGDHVHVNPDIAASHEKIIEAARVEKQNEDEIRRLNDKHDKINEEHDKAYLTKNIQDSAEQGTHLNDDSSDQETEQATNV